jgi:hypothetical protein
MIIRLCTVLTALFSLLPPGPWREQPGYTAHQIISFATMVYVTSVGASAWFRPDVATTSASLVLLGRVTEPVPAGEHLAQVLLGSNVLWDVADHRSNAQ